MLCQHGGHAAGSRTDGDHRRRDRRHQRGVPPVADGGHRRPGDRPGPVVRDRRFDVACARHHLPDQRLTDDVPHRAGHGRAVRQPRGGRRTGWYGVGGIEVATTPERMRGAEATPGVRAVLRHRRHGVALAEDAAERSPLLDPSTILGAYWVPSDGIGKGVRIVTSLARKAEANGVAFEGGVTVTGFDIGEGRVHAVQTDQGRVECERVLICAGIWGPTVGALAGVPIPLDRRPAPAGVDGPDPRTRRGDRRRRGPASLVRHQDMAMYFRHRDDHYGVGSYHHEPIVTPQSALRRRRARCRR